MICVELCQKSVALNGLCCVVLKGLCCVLSCISQCVAARRESRTT